VQGLIEARLAEEVSLAELAALVGLSPWHLCRAFRQSTGMPPHRWQVARRVERAKQMLETTALPVTAIAAAVGYDDPGQLSVAFRKAVGVTPSRWRRERVA
jgi:AraC family transcriptional regulator